MKLCPRLPQRPRARRSAAWLLAALVSLVVIPREARAELWASTAAELFRTATRVELGTITQVNASGWTYRVDAAPRGPTAVGSTVTIPAGMFHPAPASTGRLLVVCDAYQCPRAVGLERAGAWAITAYQPMDGAYVIPPVIEQGAVGPLMAGAAAPPMCMRMSVEFTDAPPGGEVRVSVAPGDGVGTAQGALVGGTRPASIGWEFASHQEQSVVVRVGPRGGGVSFRGSALARAPDGCLTLRATPETPIARTPAELTARLSGSAGSVVLGQGLLRIRPGGPIPAGDFPVVLQSEGGRSITLRHGTLLGSGVEQPLVLTNWSPPMLHVGFRHGPREMYPMILVELAIATTPWPVADVATRFAYELRTGSARWPVLYSRDGHTRVPVGTLELTRVGP